MMVTFDLPRCRDLAKDHIAKAFVECGVERYQTVLNAKVTNLCLERSLCRCFCKKHENPLTVLCGRIGIKTKAEQSFERYESLGHEICNHVYTITREKIEIEKLFRYVDAIEKIGGSYFDVLSEHSGKSD